MSPIKRFLLTLSLTAMWSPSFLFIKLAVQDLPPMTVAGCRIALATVILTGLLLWKRISLPISFQFWMHATMVGIFSIVLPFCLFCYAETTIDSSLAAIINGMTPVFTVLLAQIFIPTDKLNLQKGVGTLLCTSGLILLFAPNLLAGVSGTTIGMLAALCGAFSYGIQHIYGKKYFTGFKPFVAPTSSLIASTILLWPFILWKEQPYLLPMPSYSAIFGICGLAILGTVCAFILYYKLLETSGPTAISLVACVFPVGGMLLGMIFLGETFTLLHFLAAGLILFGMSVVNQVVKIPFLEAKPADVQ